MHRRDRTIERGVVVAALFAFLSSGCGSGGSGPAATESSPASPIASATRTISPPTSAASQSSSFPIPNGTFEMTATRREALAKGFTNGEIDKWYGSDGTQPLTVVLDDGSWRMIIEGDDGVREVGAQGTYRATENLWIPTGKDPGCPGCVYTYRWSFDGKVLSLKLLRDSAGAADFRVVRLVTEHDYVKVA